MFESLDASQMKGLGEHVVYDIDAAVTVKAKESAVVSIVKKTFAGTRVLVYDRKENEVNAVRNIHLMNDSDMVLAPGSISVLDGGRFVGQAQFTPMLPGDSALIPYGEDSTVSVSNSVTTSTTIEETALLTQEGSQKPRGIRLGKKTVRVTTYTIKNCSTDNAVEKFYIDHTADA